MKQRLYFSTKWYVEHWRNGQILAVRRGTNIVPDAYINYVLNCAHGLATQLSNWYVALFSDNYTPLASDTYASPGYTESTDYSESTRPAWSAASASSKILTSSASKASFTMAGTDTSIYGGAIVSVSTKGDTAGGGILGPHSQFDGGPLTGIAASDVLMVYAQLTGSDQ